MSRIFTKLHFWHSFTQKYLRLKLFLEKRYFFVKYYKGQRLTTGCWFLMDYSVRSVQRTLNYLQKLFKRFCWLTFGKQKLVQSKTLQEGLFVLISDFWQFRHSNFSWGKFNVKKIDKIKSPFRGSFLMNSSKYKRWRVLLHRAFVKQQAKKNELILCVYTQWICMKTWRMLIMHRMIMNK